MLSKNKTLKTKKTQILLVSLMASLALVVGACGTAATSVPSVITVAPTIQAPTTAPKAGSTQAPAVAATKSAGLPATGAATVMVTNNSQFGNLLTDSKGMTLYIFKKDTPNVSNCSGDCANLWPPLTIPSGTKPAGGPGVTGTLGTITRSDGSIQVTINQMPLYFYAPDKAPGDATGQGIKNIWYVVSPAGNEITTTGSTPASGAAAPTQAAPVSTSGASSGSGYKYP